MATATKLQQRWIDNLWGWFFILPMMTGLVILNLYPIYQTIWQTFHKVGDFGIGNTFVGTANYVRLFTDPSIWQGLLNTIIYTIVEVPFSVAIGFIFAIILNQALPARGFFRTLFFLPMVVAPAATAMVWRYLFSTNFGLLNYVLTKIGLPAVGWISNPNIAIFSLAFSGVWGSFGYITVLYLAGMQDIPKDYYEAADIDGAGFIRKHLTITLPLISPTSLFIFITRTIGAMQVFDGIFVILGRFSPVLPRTQSLVYLFYHYSFIENNRGYGATVVVLLLLVILFLTVMQSFIQKRWVHYN